jgi:y4mF family transcriptional regulator
MATPSKVEALARAVRQRRKRLGLRQREVADLAGTAERFVYSLEAGKETVRLDKLLSVLEVLGLGLAVRRGRGDIVGSTTGRDAESTSADAL